MKSSRTGGRGARRTDREDVGRRLVGRRRRAGKTPSMLSLLTGAARRLGSVSRLVAAHRLCSKSLSGKEHRTATSGHAIVGLCHAVVGLCHAVAGVQLSACVTPSMQGSDEE
ncbi:hypothetical protein Dimus_034619 [Dionaea muscipula]